MDQNKITRGVRLILEGIGDDPDREGLKDTPQRVAQMCEEIFSGTGRAAVLDVAFSEALHDNHIVYLRDVAFYSVCEHHLLPFFGKIDIAYMPQGNRVAGFSAISKIVDHFSRRLQLQERLTGQIADEIMTYLQPKGVLVMARATQLCTCMRGAHKKEMTTLTEALRGELPLERIGNLRNMTS